MSSAPSCSSGTVFTSPRTASRLSLHRPSLLLLRPRSSLRCTIPQPPIKLLRNLPRLPKAPIEPLKNASDRLLQMGAFVAPLLIDHPALAVTGDNNYEWDLTTVLVQSAIAAVWYILLMPPIIMNWMRLRWYKRKFFEMYLQFMCVFIFFPGILLWAPFLNFRRLPRDPTMKYPWDTPQEESLNNPSS